MILLEALKQGIGFSNLPNDPTYNITYMGEEFFILEDEEGLHALWFNGDGEPTRQDALDSLLLLEVDEEGNILLQEKEDASFKLEILQGL